MEGSFPNLSACKSLILIVSRSWRGITEYTLCRLQLSSIRLRHIQITKRVTKSYLCTQKTKSLLQRVITKLLTNYYTTSHYDRNLWVSKRTVQVFQKRKKNVLIIVYLHNTSTFPETFETKLNTKRKQKEDFTFTLSHWCVDNTSHCEINEYWRVLFHSNCALY